MRKEEGRGEVIGKNELLLQGDFIQQVTAVRHGNGRDWWVVLSEKNSNKFSFLLFDPTGVQFSHHQNIGENWNHQDWAGQATFFPDGTKFIRTNPYNDIHIYDFDRCDGLLSNPKFIELPADTLELGCSGAVVSSDSRFLYILAFTKIYQYDIKVPNVNNTRVTVAEYDGYSSPFPTPFFQGMLAPNEKIYITANSGVDVLHIIHQPNEKGLDCEVEQHGLQMLTKHGWHVPNFPHFRLYDMQGSPCDTLGINEPVATEEVGKGEEKIKLYPNPTTDKITIENPQLFTKNS